MAIPFRITGLNAIPDNQIALSDFLALDDPTQTFKMTLQQLRNFLQVNLTEIVMGDGEFIYFDNVSGNQGDGATRVSSTTDVFTIQKKITGTWTTLATVTNGGAIVTNPSDVITLEKGDARYTKQWTFEIDTNGTVIRGTPPPGFVLNSATLGIIDFSFTALAVLPMVQVTSAVDAPNFGVNSFRTTSRIITKTYRSNTAALVYSDVVITVVEPT